MGTSLVGLPDQLRGSNVRHGAVGNVQKLERVKVASRQVHSALAAEGYVMKDQGEEPGVRCENVLPDCQSKRGAILCGAASDDEVLGRHMSRARRLFCAPRKAQL
jgi:hypothetical protein|eukprot:3579433-Prymnesium_polylepis.2